MEITITKKSGNWTFGTIGGFNFEIKHFDEPSEFGIEDAETGIPGRISKLWISRTWGEHWTVASYWCEQRRRWLLYICRIGEFYLFEDYGDSHFLLTADEVARLKPEAPKA